MGANGWMYVANSAVATLKNGNNGSKLDGLGRWYGVPSFSTLLTLVLLHVWGRHVL